MTNTFSPEQVRVLGSLIEKEMTTPDYYPLTLNSLITACNQKSNREPVVQYDNRTVLTCLDELRDQGFAVQVELADSRVPKFEQSFSTMKGLTIQETAIMCVLMLRGPQTVGELRARTARLYPFEDMNEVEIVLETLVANEDPMVARLAVQPGRKEPRYCSLLTGELPEEELPAKGFSEQSSPMRQPSSDRIAELEIQVTALSEEIDQLKQAFEAFRAQFE